MLWQVLLNIPKSSLIFNVGLMLSCFIWTTPSPGPYFPLWCCPLYRWCQMQPCFFVCFCPLVPGMQGSGADVERWKPAVEEEMEGAAAPGVALCCGAWSDVCHCHLCKSWLSYQPYSESGLSGKFLNNLQIKLRQWIIWRVFWLKESGET